jgi:chemotaxis protein methyltransferase CheR
MEASRSNDLVRIRDLIYQSAGIFLPDNRLPMLLDRCTKRMRALGITSTRDYYGCLTTLGMRQAELASLLNEITVGETCFFRNRSRLDAIRRVVLPRILKAKATSGTTPLRIWSAGCSTGEEPYTLAMVLVEETRGQLKNCQTEVLATDINERSLYLAQEGVYSEYSLRNTEPFFLQKYFRADGSRFAIVPEVKSLVRFSRLNLADDAGMRLMAEMDMILCCNVLIYFDAGSKKQVIERFHRGLLDWGYLFLGHSESLFGLSDRFELVNLPSSTAYVKALDPTVHRGPI